MFPVLFVSLRLAFLQAVSFWHGNATSYSIMLHKLCLPRSLILKTPETVLLVLRCFIFDSVGEASPWSMAEAESTLDRGISISVDMVGNRIEWLKKLKLDS